MLFWTTVECHNTSKLAEKFSDFGILLHNMKNLFKFKKGTLNRPILTGYFIIQTQEKRIDLKNLGNDYCKSCGRTERNCLHSIETVFKLIV